MSNRTLIEINHDYGRVIDKAPNTFSDIIAEGIRGGFTEEVRDRLRPFGITVFGTRHHSDHFSIEWGGHVEGDPPRRGAQGVIPS